MTGPRRLIALLVAALALAVTTLVMVPSVRLYSRSPLDRTDAQITADALERLSFLRSALDDGAGERMQMLFPEGYFFTFVLYGLSWLDVAASSPNHRAAAVREAGWALKHLDSPAGRAAFSPDLQPAYGVFYVGWSSWLRGALVDLVGRSAAPVEATRLDQDAQALERAFATSPTPYLSAYPGQAWPVDSVVAIAALRLHDASVHAATIAAWTDAVRDRLDTGTGLIPHRVDSVTGRPLEGARGTSQAMLLRFLYDIDPEWAVQDYRRFRSLFTSGVPELPGIREYPSGTEMPGDVDSGPLFLGLSASVSMVTLGAAVIVNDADTAAALTGFAEATGSAISLGGKRRYLGGLLPVGDAFAVWSLTARSLISDQAMPQPSGQANTWWRLPWHAAALMVLTPLWTVLVLLCRRGRRPDHQLRRKWTPNRLGLRAVE